MYTFNMALVFGDAEAVYTIVCGSESPIDEQLAMTVTEMYLQNTLDNCSSIDKAVSKIAKGVQEECGYGTVIVKADAKRKIPRKEH